MARRASCYNLIRVATLRRHHWRRRTNTQTIPSAILNAPKEYIGHTGAISKLLVATFCPPPAETDGAVWVCGPDAMCAAVCGSAEGELGGVLKEVGYSRQQVYRF